MAKRIMQVLFVLLILVGLMLLGAEPIGAAQLLGGAFLFVAYLLHELFELGR